ncbi:MAG TPA: hypothetical protein VF369_03500 [candidate division Zixibacteria bacterium]
MPKPDSNLSVQISPNRLDFTSFDLAENPEMEVDIRNITTTKLGIRIMDMPSGLAKVKLSDKMIKPSEEVKLKVKLKREAENAKLPKSITLELSDPDSSRFTVPVISEKLQSKH